MIFFWQVFVSLQIGFENKNWKDVFFYQILI